MNIETISESKWVFAVDGQQVETLNEERLITRKIDKINVRDLPDLVKVLRQRVSVKNPDDGQRYYAVTDPLVNGVVQPGVWRLIKVGFTEGVHNPGQTINPAGAIIEVLAYGWAQTLIDSEARLVGGENQALQPERMIQRQYAALDFTKMGDMIEGIEGTKYVTSPVIEGKPYDGPAGADLKWRILSNKQSRAADGSGIITQTLAKNLVCTPDALPTAILMSDDLALLSPFAHDTTSVKNAYVWEYRWIDPGYAQALRNTIALFTGVIDAKVVKADDGSCNIQVLTQTNTWMGDLTQVWEHRVENPTFAAEQVQDTYSHIPLDALDGYKTTLGTADVGYKVSSLIDSTSAEDGYAKIVRVQDKLFVGTVTADNGVKTEEEAFFLLTSGVIRTTVWLGVKEADREAAMATLLVAPAGYTVLRVGNNYNGTGSCNITRTMVVKGTIDDKIQIGIEWPTFEGEKITYHYPGLNTVDAKALYVTLQTENVAGYKVDSVAIVETRYALSLVQVLSKIMVTPGEDKGHTIQKDWEWWGDGETVTKKWLNIKDADLDSALTTLSTAPTGYSVVSIGHNFNGTGAADVVRVVTKQNLDGFESAIAFPTFEGERKTNIYPGLDKTASDAKYASCQTPPAGYRVVKVDRQRGERGAIVIIQEIAKVQVAPFSLSSVRQSVYTHTFGLVTHATTVYLNVPKASIAAVKAAILALPNITVMDVNDDDNGQGAANVTYAWRAKPTAPIALGAIQQSGPSRFHQATQDRLWIDINLTDKNALATAVAAAMAGSAPYAVTTGDTIQSAIGEDAGDKTGLIKQRITKKPTSYAAADYQMQESFNPHGLKEAVMVVSVKEYPEVDYANVAIIFGTLQTFLGSPMKGKIQVSMNQNETFSMRGLKEAAPDWDNTTGTGAQVSVKNKGGIGETKSELATGVPVAEAAALVAAATADADYAMVDISMTERGQGEAAIEKTQVKKSETAVQVSETPAAGERRAMRDYTWPLVLAANVATVWTAAATHGVAGSYVLHFRQLNILGNGMFSVQSQVVEVIEKTLADYVAGYSDDSVTRVKRVRDATTQPDATDTAGVTETVQGSLNLFNKYDYVLTKVTGRGSKLIGTGEVVWVEYMGSHTANQITWPGGTPLYTSGWVSAIGSVTRNRTHHQKFFDTLAEALAWITNKSGAGYSNIAGKIFAFYYVDTVSWVATSNFADDPGQMK